MRDTQEQDKYLPPKQLPTSQGEQACLQRKFNREAFQQVNRRPLYIETLRTGL